MTSLLPLLLLLHFWVVLLIVRVPITVLLNVLKRITVGTLFSINSQLYCINHTLTSEYDGYVWQSWLAHKAHVCQPRYAWMRIRAGTPFPINSHFSCIDYTFASEYNRYVWRSWLVHQIICMWLWHIQERCTCVSCCNALWHTHSTSTYITYDT